MKRILLVMVIAACGKSSSRPAFDDKLMPPEAKGIKVGVATLDDLNKAFPGLQMTKDKTLGGEGTVEYNDAKAILAQGEGVEANIVDGKVVHLVVHAPGLRDWLVKTMDGMAGSKDCPGNRKMGNRGGKAAYCANGASKVIFIEADEGGDKDELDYHLAK